MNLKHYLIALLFAVLSAFVTTLVFWLFSLISWILVWAIVVFALIPVGICAVKFWNNHNCYDLVDFFGELSDKINDEDQSQNCISIE